jgi:hypothetical protein
MFQVIVLAFLWQMRKTPEYWVTATEHKRGTLILAPAEMFIVFLGSNR